MIQNTLDTCHNLVKLKVNVLYFIFTLRRDITFYCVGPKVATIADKKVLTSRRVGICGPLEISSTSYSLPTVFFFSDFFITFLCSILIFIDFY